MKLSEAILKGCEETRPIQGLLYDTRYTCVGGMEIRACAIGAALHTTDFGDISIVNIYSFMIEKFPILAAIVDISDFPQGILPETMLNTLTNFSTNEYYHINALGNIIIHLNDTKGWSREAIAMWVSTIEDKLEQQLQKDESITQVPERAIEEAGQMV